MRPMYKELREIMSDGQPHTLDELSEALDAHSPTISATLRAFRKDGDIIEKQYNKRLRKWLYVMPRSSSGVFTMPTQAEIQAMAREIVASAFESAIRGVRN
jgi:DNA-binding transcriptional regulator GbsR (MarR family)